MHRRYKEREATFALICTRFTATSDESTTIERQTGKPRFYQSLPFEGLEPVVALVFVLAISVSNPSFVLAASYSCRLGHDISLVCTFRVRPGDPGLHLAIEKASPGSTLETFFKNGWDILLPG